MEQLKIYHSASSFHILEQFALLRFSCSVVSKSETPWIAVWQASFTISWSSRKLISIEPTERMPSNHLMLCCSLLLPSIFPSIRVFSNELSLRIKWPKYWSFSFSISPSNEHLRLSSCRIDWFDLLAIQGTLKCLLQHHNLEASVLWHSVFFTSNSDIHI